MNSELNSNIKIHSNPVARWFFIASGIILTAVGIIGMFLPLLPTTIFLILAAWCFARSSEKFYNWLHSNKIFGRYLSDYRQGRGMSLRSKIISIGILWVGIGYSIMYGTELLYVRILLAAIGIGVTIHLMKVKTSDARRET